MNEKKMQAIDGLPSYEKTGVKFGLQTPTTSQKLYGYNKIYAMSRCWVEVGPDSHHAVCSRIENCINQTQCLYYYEQLAHPTERLYGQNILAVNC